MLGIVCSEGPNKRDEYRILVLQDGRIPKPIEKVRAALGVNAGDEITPEAIAALSRKDRFEFRIPDNHRSALSGVVVSRWFLSARETRTGQSCCVQLLGDYLEGDVPRAAHRVRCSPDRT